MTCIVGFTDKKTGITYLGGDSLASSGWKGQIINQRKVFKSSDSNNMILGFSGSVRDLDILTYAENLIDKRDEPNIDHKYIVTKLIPNLIRLFQNNYRNINDKGIGEFESYFLLGYKDKLWLIESNYAVIDISDNYNAIGCGVEYALGSLRTTEDIDLEPIEKIHLALKSASKYSIGVAPPFYIINTENDEVVEFKD